LSWLSEFPILAVGYEWAYDASSHELHTAARILLPLAVFAHCCPRRFGFYRTMEIDPGSLCAPSLTSFLFAQASQCHLISHRGVTCYGGAVPLDRGRRPRRPAAGDTAFDPSSEQRVQGTRADQGFRSHIRQAFRLLGLFKWHWAPPPAMPYFVTGHSSKKNVGQGRRRGNRGTLWRLVTPRIIGETLAMTRVGYRASRACAIFSVSAASVYGFCRKLAMEPSGATFASFVLRVAAAPWTIFETGKLRFQDRQQSVSAHDRHGEIEENQ